MVLGLTQERVPVPRPLSALTLAAICHERDFTERCSAGVNTAVLLSSSLTMHWALEGIRNENRRAMKAGLLTTFLLGLTFLSVQLNEYVHLGWAPQDNAQGTIFYCLTGLHGAHVFIGLNLLLFANIRAFRGHYSAKEHRGVEVPGIYWHFVDVMWIFVFSSLYVL